ncbi:hypothetical protein D0T66_03740 [Dysgonomonas sp. 25]|nr:hypothetical protein [Dysgonomonas sp. 25]
MFTIEAVTGETLLLFFLSQIKPVLSAKKGCFVYKMDAVLRNGLSSAVETIEKKHKKWTIDITILRG